MIAKQDPPQPVPHALGASPKLQPGAHMRLGTNPLGAWVTGPTSATDFRHPLLVTVGGMVCRVSYGLILANVAVEPVIGTDPLSSRPQPVLRLSKALVNEANESWACVEVTPDTDGKLDAERKASKVEVVQRPVPFLTEGPTGRAPLALLVLQGGRWQVHQIAFFHYRYETSLPPSGLRRHFFL